jgi:general secretion pathway protein D
LIGCSTSHDSLKPYVESSIYKLLETPEIRESTIISDHIRMGIKYLYEGKLEQASTAFNKAINKNPQSAMADFLNGLTYHLMAKEGDNKKLPLAEVGYDLAIKKDKAHAFAYYYRGILNLEKKDYKKAQEDFSNAILNKPNNAPMLHGLAISSYYLGDLSMAAGTIQKALDIEPENAKFLHTASMIMAAGGQFDDAEKYKAVLEKQANSERKAHFLTGRINDWKHFHRNYLRLASDEESALASGGFDELKNNPGDNAEADSLSETQDSKEEIDDRMVILDVVLILTQETTSDVYGLNLLENLKLNFGNGETPFMNYTWGKGFNTDFSTYNGEGPKFKNFQHVLHNITIPAVSYNINAAKSDGTRSEILARPTLLARHAKSSKFFSGDDISFGVATDSSVDFKEKQVGVFLVVTPHILKDGRINIKLDVKRSFFTPLNSDVKNSAKGGFQTSTTRLVSDVVLEAGDTLVLGGLSDRVQTNNKTGTTFLGRIPILDFFFSQSTESQVYKSVIVLVTPRLPQYTYRTTRSLKRQAKRQKSSLEIAAQQEVRGRYADWFKVYSNLGSIFHRLQANQLYREFRTGDVNLEKWESRYNILPQVEEALNSVY